MRSHRRKQSTCRWCLPLLAAVLSGCLGPNKTPIDPLHLNNAPSANAAERKQNWFRFKRTGSDVWVQAMNAGGPKRPAAVTADIAKYLADTDRSDWTLGEIRRHADLYVVDVAAPPAPEGFGRVGSFTGVIWYDAEHGKVLAESLPE